jgi:outer membrane biosynthesis protein TonB
MDSMSEIWQAWQGREINADLRLGRYLGGSDHSAVFLADPAAVAVKLVPAWPALAEAQLKDWESAAELTHPHLIRLLEAGRCTLDGQPCLYAVMEYADQNLAQLLRHRALSEDEAREVLPPALEALAYLHSRNLVQGQLKPANILAVGDQLKLAADTVRTVSDTRGGLSEASVYDPPEAREGSYAAAGDIWGLGVTLIEALTCRPPATASEGRGDIVLPRDFPPTFRELVTWCLARRPYDRPKVKEIEAWLQRRPAAAVPAGVRPPPRSAEAARPDPAPRQTDIPPPAHEPSVVSPAPVPAIPPPVPKHRSLAAPIIGAVALLVLAWAALHALRTHRQSVAATVEAARPAPPAAVAGTPPAVAGHAVPAPPQPGAAGAAAVVHSEIPNVPLRARRTIRGHIRVSVRVIVGRDANVAATLVDRPGPSRYFERLAMAAARQWTFAPADTPAQRVEALRFEFSRDGTTARAVPVR